MHESLNLFKTMNGYLCVKFLYILCILLVTHCYLMIPDRHVVLKGLNLSPSISTASHVSSGYSRALKCENGPSEKIDALKLVGEDAGAFSLEEQSVQAWAAFVAAGSVVLGGIFYAWIYPDGLHWGDDFKNWIESLAGGDSTLAIIYMLGVFAVIHSGLASLRPAAEEIIGPRAWRVIFAIASLPLAFSCIVYFINHRYDGVQLWDIRREPWLHNTMWITSFLSFWFLYPSTFNLLEVAAVEQPQLHLWETGIIRITRHPQMVGQIMWCAAHTAYIGTSFMCATSAMLCAHHLFSVWNGDRRLREKWGDRAEVVQERTSVWPFAAILSGKQQLPDNYLEEFARLPYFTIVVGTTAAYFLHPFMQAGSAILKW